MFFAVSQALVVCLESKDYTQIRNTMMVLIKVSMLTTLYITAIQRLLSMAVVTAM